MKLLLQALCVLVLLVLNRTEENCSQPWHVINTTLEGCVCYNLSDAQDTVRCSDDQVEVLFGHCLTVDDHGSHLGPCLNNLHYADYKNIAKGDKRYVTLSARANHSTVNDQMCAILHRTGPVCNECMEGYGPTVLQAGFSCAQCEWYGVLVYLLLEFGPLTIVFLILLVFPINITSAMMSGFVVYCQVVSTVLTYDTTLANAVISSGKTQAVTFHILLTLSNIWNLDFTTFVAFLPAICLSERLTNIHVILLKYLSAAYPLLLVTATYIIVQLHARGNRLLACLWRPFRQCCARTRRAIWSPQKSLVDVFASFILLSYSKLFLLFFLTIADASLTTVSFNATLHTEHVLRFDTTLTYWTGMHIPIVLFSVTVFLGLTVLPVLLLWLYPLRLFRRALNYCPLTRHQVILTMFVDKFQADYNDGLNGGGYDMRWLSSLPMVVPCGVYISAFLFDHYLSWLVYILWLLIINVTVLLLRPYKKQLMTIVNGTLLAMLIAYAVLYNTFMNNLTDPSASNPTLGTIWSCLLLLAIPHLVLYGSLLCKPVLMIYRRRGDTNHQDRGDMEEEAHRLQQPDQYTPLAN